MNNLFLILSTHVACVEASDEAAALDTLASAFFTNDECNISSIKKIVSPHHEVPYNALWYNESDEACELCEKIQNEKKCDILYVCCGKNRNTWYCDECGSPAPCSVSTAHVDAVKMMRQYLVSAKQFGASARKNTLENRRLLDLLETVNLENYRTIAKHEKINVHGSVLDWHKLAKYHGDNGYDESYEPERDSPNTVKYFLWESAQSREIRAKTYHDHELAANKKAKIIKELLKAIYGDHIERFV